jgi:hypothetical protein
VIRLTPRGAVVTAAGADVARAREAFAETHHLRLPALLDPGVLALVRREVAAARFAERVHGAIGPNRELCMEEGPAAGLLHLLLNASELLGLVEAITGCPAIGCFRGRVYRMLPGGRHRDAWHDDLGDDRLLALSLNLGDRPYRGGALQLRERGTHRVLAEVPNTGPGDAIVFRLAPGLQHRVTPVEGEVPKTAFAGWFKSRPSALAHLRALVARATAPAAAT